MNFIQYVAIELEKRGYNITEHDVRNILVVAADKTVREYLDHGQITDSDLSNEEQAEIVAAVRLADPSFPRHALKRKIAKISPKKKRFPISL